MPKNPKELLRDKWGIGSISGVLFVDQFLSPDGTTLATLRSNNCYDEAMNLGVVNAAINIRMHSLSTSILVFYLEDMNTILHKTLTYCIATVWLVNGFFCKLLNIVPRHSKIVAKILGTENAAGFTMAIGIAEVLMAIWILSRLKPRFCAIVQIVIVAVMNMLEFFLTPELLLFGKLNAVVALFFITIVYCNTFIFNNKYTLPS